MTIVEVLLINLYGRLGGLVLLDCSLDFFFVEEVPVDVAVSTGCFWPPDVPAFVLVEGSSSLFVEEAFMIEYWNLIGLKLEPLIRFDQTRWVVN